MPVFLGQPRHMSLDLCPYMLRSNALPSHHFCRHLGLLCRRPLPDRGRSLPQTVRPQGLSLPAQSTSQSAAATSFSTRSGGQTIRSSACLRAHWLTTSSTRAVDTRGHGQPRPLDRRRAVNISPHAGRKARTKSSIQPVNLSPDMGHGFAVSAVCALLGSPQSVPAPV